MRNRGPPTSTSREAAYPPPPPTPMPQPSPQLARRITSANQQQKSKYAPVESIIYCLVFIWLIVVVQFYRHGTYQQEQQPSFSDFASKDRLNSPAIRRNSHSRNGPNNAPGVIRNARFTNKDDNNSPEHYMTFSTACSSSQDWQSFLFFYHAYKVRQPGHVVRIASACSEQQKKDLVELHETVISKLSPKFSIHFTPDFARISGDNYKYYNKPFGLRHWLEHGLRYEQNKEKLEDVIVMILDPDMILLRPLTYDFTDSNVIVHKSKRGTPEVRKVMHGQPWASTYGFGDGPFRVDLKHVFANHTNSPALNLTNDEKRNNYPGGPPYMATGRDMYRIVTVWCELVTRVHDVYKHLLGEMYAWSLAAAHLGLPHTLAESFMVSDVDVPKEGWPLIDVLGDDEVCEYSISKEKEEKLPYVLHYCQSYWLGKWFVGKYRLDKEFLSCDKPLLLEPPKDIGKKYDFYIKPGGKPYGAKVKLKPSDVKREQFMICQMIARLNDAATWYKTQTCDEGFNLDKSFIFHHNLDPDNNEGGEKTGHW